eukprot:3223606-Alexandrium_andersonii.AAC.1
MKAKSTNLAGKGPPLLPAAQVSVSLGAQAPREPGAGRGRQQRSGWATGSGWPRAPPPAAAARL